MPKLTKSLARRGRVLAVALIADRMTTYGHFMERRYFAFDRPLTIAPPRTASGS